MAVTLVGSVKTRSGSIVTLSKHLIVGGGILSLYRVFIDDDLNVSLTKHKSYKEGLSYETWDETVHRELPRLKELEAHSIDIIRENCFSPDRRIVNTNSTGKDSMVVMRLAEKSGLEFETCFNVTTLDVAESNRMAKRNGFDFITPPERYKGFYDYIKRYYYGVQMIPSRLNRFCCNIFKEGATVENYSSEEKITFLFGMRNEESQTRSGYEDTIKNPKWGNRDWIGVLPIRTWSELDIWLYTILEGIEINDKYKYGYSRVGCGIACPYYTKYTWALDKYWYPYLYKRWRDILRNDFISSNRWLIMNCTVDEYVTKAWPGGVFRDEPTDEVILEYSEYSGLDPDIAKNYFNRYCMNGCLNKRGQPLKIKDKSALAMNMKMFGRHIDQFKCKKCLMKEFGWTNDDWVKKVTSFKAQGCRLF